MANPQPLSRFPQGGYVSLRGWLTTPAAAVVGTALFRLPAVAAPNRTEEWRVVLKVSGAPPLPSCSCILFSSNELWLRTGQKGGASC